MVYSWNKNAKLFGIAVMACAVLGACNHSSEHSGAQDDVAETIDLTTGRNVERMRDIVEGRQEIMNLSVLSNVISDGRVEVFDPASADNLVMDQPSDDQRRTTESGIDVNRYVTVFPLDDEVVAAPISVADLQVEEPSYAAPLHDNYISVGLENGSAMKVHFDHNSARLRSDALQDLQGIAKTAIEAREPISIEGHASRHSLSGDKTRRIMGNLKISMNRAYNVARELVRRGVPAEAIRLVGWGETRLPATGADGEAARRVEVMPLADSR